MIAYDTNGVTLFFIDAKGQKYSRGPNDGQEYQDLLDIMGAQSAAKLVNKENVDDYKQKLNIAQVNEDASRPGGIVPLAPKECLVDDYGKTTWASFNPPLPVLVVKKVDPTGPIKVPTIDRQVIMQNQIAAMFNKMFPPE